MILSPKCCIAVTFLSLAASAFVASAFTTAPVVVPTIISRKKSAASSVSASSATLLRSSSTNNADPSKVDRSSKNRDPSKVDYNAVAKDIVNMINHSKQSPQDWGPKKKSVGPTLIRLAWHSSGSYGPVPPNKPPAGGSEGGTMRFAKEQSDPPNAGLAESAVRWMDIIHENHPGISYGDLYTLAGVVAVKTLGGPTIPWSYGRVDGTVADVPPQGRLPEPATPPRSAASKLDAENLRQIFGRMGFDDQEIVILSGAHAVGRCHIENSEYDGSWQFREEHFDNPYYQMLNIPRFFWRERNWDGPVQYRLACTRPSRVMMLPTDIILKEDRKFRKFVRKYARDQDAFYEDFAKTFDKLLTLGTKNLTYIDLDYDTTPAPRRRRQGPLFALRTLVGGALLR